MTTRSSIVPLTYLENRNKNADQAFIEIQENFFSSHYSNVFADHKKKGRKRERKKEMHYDPAICSWEPIQSVW